MSVHDTFVFRFYFEVIPLICRILNFLGAAILIEYILYTLQSPQVVCGSGLILLKVKKKKLHFLLQKHAYRQCM